MSGETMPIEQLSPEEGKALLKLAEDIWDNLQRNELGGASGITLTITPPRTKIRRGVRY